MRLLSKVMVLLFLALIFSSSLLLAEQEESDDADFYKLVYQDFQSVKSFGTLAVLCRGEDARKIGLDAKKLTDLLKLKFKNDFVDVPYEDQTGKNIDFVLDDQFGPAVGRVVITVWIVGDDYPIAYHMEIVAGTIEEREIYTNSVLGYGSKQNVPDTVKSQIGKFVEELAIVFFKARGEF
jgi:hypothetical protein